MKHSPFDNLPELSQQEALDILATPICKLELSSDYYKAAYHLSKYPGTESENALLGLIQSQSTDKSILIAKRQAVEGLARLGCQRAIPMIGSCLNSKDPYLIEIAAWALSELRCRDSYLIKQVSKLLTDKSQNRRVLIQSLAGMEATSELAILAPLMKDFSLPPTIQGAAIAAVKRLSGKADNLFKLIQNLELINQNDRQCAIQDIINSGSPELLPFVLKTPVATSFRLRAMNQLCPDLSIKIPGLNVIKSVDLLIMDDPNNLILLHSYEKQPDISFLIEELYGTDFSRAYLALRTLLELDAIELWNALEFELDKAMKDYGAIHFFSILFGKVHGWQIEALQSIKTFLLSAMDGRWPAYMKFKPVAIISLIKLFPDASILKLDEWLDESRTPFWASRYATLLALETSEILDSSLPIDFQSMSNDSNHFVREKAKILLEKIDVLL